MPVLPIPHEEYPAIREAIDTELVADDLPDEVISRTTVAGAAEDWIEDSDPDWATRTGRQERAILRAAIYYCASLLVRRVALMTSETMGNYRYTVVASDPDKLIADLRSMADSELAVAKGVNPDESWQPEVVFTAARGARGR